MQFIIHGAIESSGREVSLQVSAASEQEASEIAQSQGIFISSIMAVSASPLPCPAQTGTRVNVKRTYVFFGVAMATIVCFALGVVLLITLTQGDSTSERRGGVAEANGPGGVGVSADSVPEKKAKDDTDIAVHLLVELMKSQQGQQQPRQGQSQSQPSYTPPTYSCAWCGRAYQSTLNYYSPYCSARCKSEAGRR